MPAIRSLIATVLVLSWSAVALADGGKAPDSVRALLQRYEAAWEARDYLGLAELGPQDSPLFQDLLDDERLDAITRTLVTLRDVEAVPHRSRPGMWVVRFTKIQEDVLAGGTVTRGVARIEALVREGDPAQLLNHSVISFPESERSDYRPDEPSTWGDEHLPVERAFYKGYRALQRGDCTSALQAFSTIDIARGPDGQLPDLPYESGAHRFCAQVEHFRAVCELRRGDREQAVALAQKAIEINPEFPKAHNFLAERALESADITTAVKHWRRSLELHPEQPDIQAELEFHQKALHYYPTPELRAHYLSIRGLPPARAATKLARLKRLSPDDPETRRRLAVCYLLAMQPEKAKRELTENEYHHLHDLETQYLLARTYIEMKRLDDAAAMLARVWARRPNYRDTAVLAAEVYARLKRYPDAVGVLQDALLDRPRDAALLYKMASFLRHMNRDADAKTYLREAAHNSPPASIRRAVYEALRSW